MNIIDRIELPYDRLMGRLLVRELEPHAMSKGGILLSDDAKERRTICEVLKLSPDVGWALFGKDARDVRKEAPNSIPKVGDLVVAGKHSLRAADLHSAGNSYGAEDEGLSMVHPINTSDVLVIVKKEK